MFPHPSIPHRAVPSARAVNMQIRFARMLCRNWKKFQKGILSPAIICCRESFPHPQKSYRPGSTNDLPPGLLLPFYEYGVQNACSAFFGALLDQFPFKRSAYGTGAQVLHRVAYCEPSLVCSVSRKNARKSSVLRITRFFCANANIIKCLEKRL